MSILDKAPPSFGSASTSDEAAIAELHAAFAAQRAAFHADRQPDLAERKSRIGKLMGMLLGHREQISAALSQDFGCHPVPASDLIEVLGPVARANYVLERLEEWMRPSPRDVDAAMLGTAQAYIQSQPKGVVGNIVPWNFPFDLSVGPMIEMLAAGNRVIVKPSEFTPACAALLREMVAKTFEPTLVHVVVGGLDLARAFSELRWDHLLYTGSPNVGRQIMQAAARNLTPVTLELGGKCPALLTPGSVTAANVDSVIGTKTVKNGQMCISVDYCLVPRADVDHFVSLSKAFMARVAENYSQSEDCTGIISERHLDRLCDLLDEARDRASTIVPLEPNGAIDRQTRRMPISLVIDPKADLRIMQEEIFGPILPVVPYDDLNEAVAMINASERPLGLYVFGDDQATIAHVLGQITSGGAAVNTCALQGALPSLAFGGVGMSGMGRHHGIEGFREFSNQRGVVVRGEGDHIDAFFAPYGKAAALVQAALG
ncbi:aldehyde dehydrogenase family protein [Lichenicoccus sp.]|uniref:aldehyde dehydrogenase family protein n=1 Tax=Lichenicoccus sp. TaxID=2781899 RepID=UPI003D0B09C7